MSHVCETTQLDLTHLLKAIIAESIFTPREAQTTELKICCNGLFWIIWAYRGGTIREVNNKLQLHVSSVRAYAYGEDLLWDRLGPVRSLAFAPIYDATCTTQAVRALWHGSFSWPLFLWQDTNIESFKSTCQTELFNGNFI